MNSGKSFLPILISFMLFMTGCLDKKGYIDGEFALDGFTFDVEAPAVAVDNAGNSATVSTSAMPTMYVQGYKMIYDSGNHSLIFPCNQNGLGCVAEYFLP